MREKNIFPARVTATPIIILSFGNQSVLTSKLLWAVFLRYFFHEKITCHIISRVQTDSLSWRMVFHRAVRHGLESRFPRFLCLLFSHLRFFHPPCGDYPTYPGMLNYYHLPQGSCRSSRNRKTRLIYRNCRRPRIHRRYYAGASWFPSREMSRRSLASPRSDERSFLSREKFSGRALFQPLRSIQCLFVG